MLTLHISCTLNNTIFTITNSSGDTLFWSSSGLLGFKGTKRSSPFAAESTGIKVGNILIKEHNCNQITIRIKGIGSGRFSSIKGLKKSGINIVSLKDITPIPHNGCRPSKKRRL